MTETTDTDATTMRAWRAEGQRDELLAKYVAVHEAINHVREKYPAHTHKGGDASWSNRCGRCGVEALAGEVLERMASAVPPVGPRA